MLGSYINYSSDQKLVTCTGLIYYKLTSYFYPRGGGAIVRKGCAVRPCPCLSSNFTEEGAKPFLLIYLGI